MRTEPLTLVPHESFLKYYYIKLIVHLKGSKLLPNVQVKKAIANFKHRRKQQCRSIRKNHILPERTFKAQLASTFYLQQLNNKGYQLGCIFRLQDDSVIKKEINVKNKWGLYSVNLLTSFHPLAQYVCYLGISFSLTYNVKAHLSMHVYMHIYTCIYIHI